MATCTFSVETEDSVDPNDIIEDLGDPPDQYDAVEGADGPPRCAHFMDRDGANTVPCEEATSPTQAAEIPSKDNVTQPDRGSTAVLHVHFIPNVYMK